MLDELDFDPCALAHWTQLQRLELNSVYFTTPVVSQDVLCWAAHCSELSS
jgi:hypothetical protein